MGAVVVVVVVVAGVVVDDGAAVVVVVVIVLLGNFDVVVVVVEDPTTLPIIPGALPDFPGPAQSIMTNWQIESVAQIKNKLCLSIYINTHY